jgi:ubiquinone/menaquinone biosynthesis C-methylase UbiE
MSRTYTNRDVAKRYDSARALPQDTIELWMTKLKQLLPLRSVQRILDLGCGTGRFILALQATFKCPVIAVDPSDAMLNQGKARGYETVDWIRGSAEHIPLLDNTVDLVWMCQVFHHLDAPQASFQEIRRVLMPPGCLVIRNGTRENEAEIEWAQFFPEAQQIDEERLLSQQEVVDLVSTQGFALITEQTIPQYFASSYQKYYDKIAERGLSSLISISDAAFYAGLQKMEQWVAKQPPDKPVYEPVDLFVFRVVK